VNEPDPSTRSTSVRRWIHGRWEAAEADVVAAEEPLEIRVDTRSVSVTLRTPGHDDELAAGFLVSEGLLRSRSDLRAIRHYPRNASGNVVDVFLDEAVTFDFASLTRHVFASSSCGLCGTASIEALHRGFPSVTRSFQVTPEVLLSLPGRLRAAQAGFSVSGGLHGAALFSPDGDLWVAREDVGRHNAVDKVIGRRFLDGLTPSEPTVLMVSGRVSFEIVQKALAAGIAVIAAVSAPSSLAVEFAERSGQTLVGFLREGRFNVYAGSECIGPGGAATDQ
jgi:FdhD protein